MKTLLTMLLFAIAGTAISSDYKTTMNTKLEKLYTITSSDELQDMANQFERIANAEPDKWLPSYYAAYCYARSTFFDNMEADTKHIQLDKAQQILDKLFKTHNNESEIHALQALVFQLRITDMGKGATYSKKAAAAIAVAEKLNAQNPRVYYLRGSNTFHTPKFFGGGATKAKADLEKAAQLFETYKPQNNLMPTWGAYHNQQLLEQCNKQE